MSEEEVRIYSLMTLPYVHAWNDSDIFFLVLRLLPNSAKIALFISVKTLTYFFCDSLLQYIYNELSLPFAFFFFLTFNGSIQLMLIVLYNQEELIYILGGICRISRKIKCFILLSVSRQLLMNKNPILTKAISYKKVVSLYWFRAIYLAPQCSQVQVGSNRTWLGFPGRKQMIT